MAEDNQIIDIQIKRITVVAVAVAGAIAIIEGPGNFDLWSTMTGIVLLIILQVFVLQNDNNTTVEPLPNQYELAVFNAVWALCFLITIGFILDILSNGLIALLNMIPSNLQTSSIPPPGGNIKQIDDLISSITNVLSNIMAFVIWLFIARNREAITSNPRYLSLFRIFIKAKQMPTTPSNPTASKVALSVTKQPATSSSTTSSSTNEAPTTATSSESSHVKQISSVPTEKSGEKKKARRSRLFFYQALQLLFVLLRLCLIILFPLHVLRVLHPKNK